MSQRVAYTYTVLRYRHDAVTGEWLNVGVVLHSPKSGFLGMKARHTYGRVSQVFPDVDPEAFKSSLRSIDKAIQEMSDAEARGLFASHSDALAYAKRALIMDDSSFVWGELGSGLTTDPLDTLQGLYARFVERYEQAKPKSRDDEVVWRPVRDGLQQRSILHHLQEKTISSTIGDEVRFDHAWKNAKWHCFQPLSFDLVSADSIRDKAHRWTGRLWGLEESTEKFKPYFFVGRPADRKLFRAYDTALAVLRRSPHDPEIFEETHTENLLDYIEDQIKSHD